MTSTLSHTVGTAGRLAILSREELERLDAAALEVLAETGVSIPSERARAALAAKGRPSTARASDCSPSWCGASSGWRRRG